MMKILFLGILFFGQVFGRAIDDDNNQSSGEGDAEDPDKRILMPGTKWCGMGNKASSYDDLGSYVELDRCCRTHDHCDKKVEAFSSKYGYSSWSPFTISDCKCDRKFYDCMKAVKEHKTATKVVGKLFFDILGMPCLKFNEEGTKATKGSSPSW